MHDWYLKEWLPVCGVNAAWLERETGWTHRITSNLINRRVRWNRDHLSLAAQVLKVRPHELLMSPEEAMHIRRLRAGAAEEYRLRVAEQGSGYRSADPADDPAGDDSPGEPGRTRLQLRRRAG